MTDINKLQDKILTSLQQHTILSSRQLADQLRRDKEEINSLLYGPLRTLVIRDKDERGYPVWRLRTQAFEAAKGLEVQFYTELLKRKIVTEDNSQLDYPIEHPKYKKVYHLDIAIFAHAQKYDIEIDGFEHMRADAIQSIGSQLARKGEQTKEIEIDWMDNKTSYAEFKSLDTKSVFRWCSRHLDWCITYHEELIWPHDITRNIWLIENGWRIIRFWNEEIRKNMDRCVQDVRQWKG
jgi:hypothetical protein